MMPIPLYFCCLVAILFVLLIFAYVDWGAGRWAEPTVIRPPLDDECIECLTSFCSELQELSLSCEFSLGMPFWSCIGSPWAATASLKLVALSQ